MAHAVRLLFGFALLVCSIASVAAQPVDFTGRQIKMLIGFGPGGGYDLYGRLLARHIGRYLPGNPTVVPQNMPGGGSLFVARRIYAQSPKDGTEMGIVARDAITSPLISTDGENAFDATKFSWLGSPDSETSVCVANAASGVRTGRDLLSKELVVGADGVGTGTFIYPTILNGLVGTKFKIVNGYTSSNEIFLAMERREVEGSCESFSSVMRKSSREIKDGKIVVLFWGGYPQPELKSVMNISEFVTDPDDRKMVDFMYSGLTYARPFIAPPGLPDAVYKVLKDAFAKSLEDAELRADAAQQKLEIRPVSAEETAAIVKRAYATPKAVIDRMGKILKDGGG